MGRPARLTSWQPGHRVYGPFQIFNDGRVGFAGYEESGSHVLRGSFGLTSEKRVSGWWFGTCFSIHWK